jgi:hypothetical protein
LAQIIYITPEGKRVKPILEDALFHELTHAADADNARRMALMEKWEQTRNRFGVGMQPDARSFIADDQMPQTQAFSETLPPSQKEAFKRVMESAYLYEDKPKAFEAVYQQKLPLLLQNPVLRDQYHAAQSEKTWRMEAEDLAVDRTNAFLREFLGKDAYTRGAYQQGRYGKAFIPYPEGKVIQGELTPHERRVNDAAQKDWVREHGEHVTSPDSTLHDFKGVPPPDPKGRVFTDVLPSSHASLKVSEVEANQRSFTPSPTPASGNAEVRHK